MKIIEVKIDASPKLAAYLQDLVDLEEGYGETREEVAKNLCWRMVEHLIGGGILAKIGDLKEAPAKALALLEDEEEDGCPF